jgi:translocation and assembly module TamB
MRARRAVQWIGFSLLFAGALALAMARIVESDLIQPWIRNVVIRQIVQRTGTRVEMKSFHLDTWRLHADVDGLTLHGLEAPGVPPLFYAEHVSVSLRVISFFGRRIALDRLILDHPQFAVRIEKDGRSNLPKPSVQETPLRPATLFDLQISLLQLRDGSANFNDRSIPLSIQGQNLQFALNYGSESGNVGAYIGVLQWQQVELAEHRDRPFRFDISTKFTLRPNSFELNELVWKLPHSELDLQADLPSFAKNEWDLKYRGRLSLTDVRTIFSQPTTPYCLADF